ncbi:MAG: hypothetical protein ACP5RI_04130, partial [Candidatus Micrarchaeia archaeon]
MVKPNLLNIFTINEDYPEDSENRLTASFMFLLSECRYTLLPKFLKEKMRISDNYDINKINIDFQIREEGVIPDAVIYNDDFYILIE